jgi:glycosyltransferase involved in cell wall biosynthesis
MKLLAVYSTDNLLGGGELSFTLSVQAIQQLGWRSLALLPGRGPLSESLDKKGIQFAVAPQTSFRADFAARYLFRPHPEWLRIAEQFKPDIIHCNSVRAALYGQAVARALSIPAIFHARIAERHPLIDTFLVRRTATVICTSGAVRHRFPFWVRGRSLKILPNPIDPDFPTQPTARSTQLRRQWLGEKGTHLIGVIGRLSEDKGQAVMIESAADIVKEFPGARFVCIGGKDPAREGYADLLHSMILERKLSAYFCFPGFEHSMGDAYHALDIVAFPTKAEGFGRVAIEAGAARKPLVATDIPALREIVSSKFSEILVSYDPKAFSQAILRLLNDESRRVSIAEALHERVMSEFSFEKHRARLVEIYTSVLHASKRHAK